MLRRSWQAGLQLEVVEHIVTASRKVGFNLTIVLLLCYAELQLELAKRTVLVVRREELGCRSYRRGSSGWEAVQSRTAQIRG